MTHFPPPRSPNVLLWIQIRRSDRKLDDLQARIGLAQCANGQSAMVGRAIPQQQDIDIGMGIQDRLQVEGRRLGIHGLGARDDLAPSLEVEGAIVVGVCSTRITAHGEGLPSWRPYRHRAGLQIDFGLIFSQNDGVGCILGDVDQFFSSKVSNSITAASLRDLKTLVG